MRDARKRKLIRMWGLCLPSGFWLLASGPSPNFSLSQSPSAAPVVLFRVRYSSAARVLCPFLVFFFLSLFLSDLRFRFRFRFLSFFSFFFGVVWSLVLIPCVGFCEEACFHFLDQQLFHSAFFKAYLRKARHPLPWRLHESDFREKASEWLCPRVLAWCASPSIGVEARTL